MILIIGIVTLTVVFLSIALALFVDGQLVSASKKMITTSYNLMCSFINALTNLPKQLCKPTVWKKLFLEVLFISPIVVSCYLLRIWLNNTFTDSLWLKLFICFVGVYLIFLVFISCYLIINPRWGKKLRKRWLRL